MATEVQQIDQQIAASMGPRSRERGHIQAPAPARARVVRFNGAALT